MGADIGGIVVIYLALGLGKFALDCAMSPSYSKVADESGLLAAGFQIVVWPLTLVDSIRRWVAKYDVYNCDSRHRIFDVTIEECFAEIMLKLERTITPPVRGDSFIKGLSQIAANGSYNLDNEQLATDDPSLLFMMMTINKIRYKMPSYNLTEGDMTYIIAKFQEFYNIVLEAKSAES